MLPSEWFFILFNQHFVMPVFNTFSIPGLDSWHNLYCTTNKTLKIKFTSTGCTCIWATPATMLHCNKMKSLSILCKRNILNDFQTTIIDFQTVELFCKTWRPLGRGKDAESKLSKSAFIQQPLRSLSLSLPDWFLGHSQVCMQSIQRDS